MKLGKELGAEVYKAWVELDCFLYQEFLPTSFSIENQVNTGPMRNIAASVSPMSKTGLIFKV